MSHSTPTLAESSPPERPFSLKRRILWLVGIFVGLLILGGTGAYFFEQSRAKRSLENTIGTLDASDPGWRLEEIEEARESIPESENSARLAVRLAKHLGPGWPKPAFHDKMTEIPMAELLDLQRMALLEAEMVRLSPIRHAARPLADMPRGRHNITYAVNPLGTLLPDAQDMRMVANLFHYEMIYLSNKGDITGAIRSGRACICTGRSMDDEPFLISQLVRIAIISVGLREVERSLSLGEASEQELIALQKLLAEEAKHNTLLVGVRGERAMFDQLFSRIASGALSGAALKDMGLGDNSLVSTWAIYPRWQFRRQRPIMMDMMTRAVENARLPEHKQSVAEKALDMELIEKRQSATLVAQLMPAIQKVSEACRRKSAQVATMRTLLAVERYRMKHGKWPTRLDDVVPAFLDRIPLDPYDGKPLRMVRVADGVIVYSLGPDGTDNGGKLNRERPTEPGTDIGFQLWDVAKRRQPARPTAKAAEEKKP